MNASLNYICSFFAHRFVEITSDLEIRLKNVVENLIINKNVGVFLFGSKSNFYDLCHKVVTELQKKYPYIKRIAYVRVGELACLKEDKEKLEKAYSSVLKKSIVVNEFDEVCYNNFTGKGSYVERNYAMIKNSDFCVFYYNDEYLPPLRTYSKRSLAPYQPKSGTRCAYEYAVKLKKNIINLCDKK